MTNQISIQSLPSIYHNNIPVITTELLANVYETDAIRIQQNHTRNADRFVEGKHFFKLTGSILKEFKNRLSLSESVDNRLTQGKFVKNRVTESYSVKNRVSSSYSVDDKVTQSNFVDNRPSLRGLVGSRARSLILWTERGAARHAKMLDTDKAWGVFEKLEDFYFNQKEQITTVDKTTVQQRNPLKNAVNLLVSKKGIMYPEAYSLIHQRFNVVHIDELTADQLPQAVEYIHRIALEGEYIPKVETTPPSGFIDDEIMRLRQSIAILTKGYGLWKDNLYFNLLNLNVHFAGYVDGTLTDALGLLRDLERRISDRVSSNRLN
jgi:hypothetical protein